MRIFRSKSLRWFAFETVCSRAFTLSAPAFLMPCPYSALSCHCFLQRKTIGTQPKHINAM